MSAHKFFSTTLTLVDQINDAIKLQCVTHYLTCIIIIIIIQVNILYIVYLIIKGGTNTWYYLFKHALRFTPEGLDFTYKKEVFIVTHDIYYVETTEGINIIILCH